MQTVQIIEYVMCTDGLCLWCWIYKDNLQTFFLGTNLQTNL